MEAAPHVVVIAFPFASHAVKLFRLARSLAALAPAATFSFLSTASSIAQLSKQNVEANLRFVEVADGYPPAAAASDAEAAAPGPPNPMLRLELFLAAAEAGAIRDALALARASAGGARVTCVVGDAFVWMAGEAAAAVAAPWVAVWTGGPSTLLVHLRALALRADIGDRAGQRADELLTSHPGLGCYRVRDLPHGVLSDENAIPIMTMFRRVAEHLPRAASAVALNTFPGLLPDDVTAALAAELPECLPIGPFHHLPVAASDGEGDTTNQTDPHGCLAWLDSQPARGAVYISFGTIVSAMTTPEELQELAAGMEACGAPFLWSLPERFWPQLPPGFLERAKVVPWAPQADILRHAAVGAFVTHAGWASVLEGVCAGVPMACRPYFSDQMMNARLVAVVWRVGTAFDGPVTRGGLAAAVSSLLTLTGEEGHRMRERMQQLKGMAAGAFAPDGGSTHNLDRLAKIVCAIPQV